MSEINWEVEHERFMTLVYPRTLKAAKRAFSGWHISKIDDVTAELVGKVWDSFIRLRLRGRDPEPMINSLIRWGLWWCRYDRKIAGRKARTPDVYDYRSNMKKQMLSDQGAAPTDRSDPRNAWIDWTTQAGDDPCQLASALEETGISLAQWCDL